MFKSIYDKEGFTDDEISLVIDNVVQNVIERYSEYDPREIAYIFTSSCHLHAARSIAVRRAAMIGK